jgi:predicted TIM-barrel fold metal-dependent hydrolase
LGLAGAAGADDADLQEVGTRFADIRPGAWLPDARLADQDVDGVAGEVLYPTIGLFLIDHPDRAFATACLTAYNRWLADFCSYAPSRLIGCGASAANSAEDLTDDVTGVRATGLRGVLLPLASPGEPYSSPAFDRAWATAADLRIPVSFHALPPRRRLPALGPASAVVQPVWEAQELLTELIFGGVLHRSPGIRFVFAEFDAGWVPHFVQRLDHHFHRNYRWLRLDSAMDRPPSHYVRESVHFTFEDDEFALSVLPRDGMNVLWGNDFPHAESTWPHSRRVAARAAASLPRDEYRAAFGDRLCNLYRIR